MTTFDLRSRLEDVASEFQPGAVPPIADIESEARRLRRARTTRRVVLAASATVALVVAVPILAGIPSRNSSPSEPPDVTQTNALPADDGRCALGAGLGKVHETLLLVNSDCTTTPVEVPGQGEGQISYASMSPDGTSAAFVISRVGDDTLELIDIGTGHRRTLAASPDTLGDPVWSPDGASVGFWRNEPGVGSRIYVVPTNGGPPSAVTAGTNDVFPAWSPDGAEIAFNRGSDLWVVDVDSRIERELSETPRGVDRPFWGTDGDSLYGIRTQGSSLSSFQVVQLDPSSGALIRSSDPLQGAINDAVQDAYGIQVAALTLPAPTTVLTTLNSEFGATSVQTVGGAEISNLRSRFEVREGSTRASKPVLITQSGDGARDALIRGTLTLVGNCAGIGSTPVVWPAGTTIVEDFPLTLNVPDLGVVQAGDRVSGGGGFFDTATDDVAIEIPESCGTTEGWIFSVH